MGDLTKNISQHELDCKCGCGYTIDPREPVIQIVQNACDHFARHLGFDKVVLTITSGARCTEYNRIPVAEGGPGSNDGSQHPAKRAIDFQIAGVHPAAVYGYLCDTYPDSYGFGKYNSFTHADSRPWKARWDMT